MMILRRSIALRAAALFLVVAPLGGCAYLGGEEVSAVVDVKPADELFARAEEAFNAQDYKTASELYDEVERLHPTSTYTKKAVLKSAESAYRDYDYDKAQLAAQRFLEFYPSDAQAPYAQYLIAMSYYSQITDVDRDQAVTRAALQSMRELINRYPDSEYAREAQVKLDLTVDQLAGKEMMVGRYYLKRKSYVGAINRFKTVVEQYQNTTHVPEALHRLVECYLALGVVNEAQTAAAVLGHNFPGSTWYLDSYALLTGQDLRPAVDDESWVAQVWRRVGRGEWL